MNVLGKPGIRIAFSGKAGVGKDTAYTIINKFVALRTGKSVRNYKFADPLYDIMHYAMDTCLFDRTKDRSFLQFVGTEWARAKDPNVWVNVMKFRLAELSMSEDVVITDLRFPNELDALTELGFKIIRIEPEGQFVQNGYMSSTQSTHSSETALDSYKDWTMTIRNNGTEDYNRVVIHALQNLYPYKYV